MGLVDQFAGDGVVSCEASHLSQELVAVDVVDPGRRHGFLKGSGILLVVASGRHALNSAQLSQGVHSVCLERFNKLLVGRLVQEEKKCLLAFRQILEKPESPLEERLALFAGRRVFHYKIKSRTHLV